MSALQYCYCCCCMVQGEPQTTLQHTAQHMQHASLTEDHCYYCCLLLLHGQGRTSA
jgi:hypothetical protein